MGNENVVFSKFVGAGKRKYFLDVKKARTGSLYLSIREVADGETPEKTESRRIMVFDNAIRQFSEAFGEAVLRIPAKERTARETEKAVI